MWKKNKDVTIQSSTSPLFQYNSIIELKTDITLTNPVAVDDEIIQVSPGHGFLVGESLIIWENNIFSQFEVISVSTNDISVNIPSSGDFTTSAKVIRGDTNLNKDGSITPVEFIFKGYNTQIPIDISKVILQLQHGNNVPDDGKFSGIGALAKGLYFRRTNGGIFNLGNYKSNIDFKLRGFETVYTLKAPSGGNATEMILDIQSTFGQVIRLNPRNNDCIIGKIRDDLSPIAGIDYFKLSLIGSYTSGE